MSRTSTARPSHAKKQEEVDRLNDRFKRAEIAILAEVRGVTVDKVTDLRANLRKGEVEFKVVKNTLAKRAIKGTAYEPLADRFKGPIAVAFSFDDVVHPAKLLDGFAKTEKGLTIIGGSMKDKALSVAEIEELAGLPDLDTSRARLLGFLMQPAASMARLLDAYAKKLGGGEETKGEGAGEAKTEGETPAAEAPAAEAKPTEG